MFASRLGFRSDGNSPPVYKKFSYPIAYSPRMMSITTLNNRLYVAGTTHAPGPTNQNTNAYTINADGSLVNTWSPNVNSINLDWKVAFTPPDNTAMMFSGKPVGASTPDDRIVNYGINPTTGVLGSTFNYGAWPIINTIPSWMEGDNGWCYAIIGGQISAFQRLGFPPYNNSIWTFGSYDYVNPATPKALYINGTSVFVGCDNGSKVYPDPGLDWYEYSGYPGQLTFVSAVDIKPYWTNFNSYMELDGTDIKQYARDITTGVLTLTRTVAVPNTQTNSMIRGSMFPQQAGENVTKLIVGTSTSFTSGALEVWST